MNHVLLVDDDVELCQLLEEYLVSEGFVVDMAHDGEAALVKLHENDFDAVVLDVMMPKLNGFDTLRQLREFSQIPVLMLTAKGDDVDSVLGLELGADDYLSKPCNPRVLLARIRAILRRLEFQDNTYEKSSSIEIEDNIEVDTSSHSVNLNGQVIRVTGTEYILLTTLREKAGTVISKDDLSNAALGRKVSQFDRSLDMHISNLRKKLGLGPNNEERIQTIRGVGYLYTLPIKND